MRTTERQTDRISSERERGRMAAKSGALSASKWRSCRHHWILDSRCPFFSSFFLFTASCYLFLSLLPLSRFLSFFLSSWLFVYLFRSLVVLSTSFSLRLLPVVLSFSFPCLLVMMEVKFQSHLDYSFVSFFPFLSSPSSVKLFFRVLFHPFLYSSRPLLFCKRKQMCVSRASSRSSCRESVMHSSSFTGKTLLETGTAFTPSQKTSSSACRIE